jgi:hypothetical protein
MEPVETVESPEIPKLSNLEVRKLELLPIVEHLFADDPEYQEIEFPPSLTSFDRKALYELCEEKGLETLKVENEKSKYVCVRMPGLKILNV